MKTDSNISPSSDIKSISSGNNETDYIVFGNGAKNLIILPGLSIHSITALANEIAMAYREFCTEYTVYVLDRIRNISEGYTIENMASDTAEAMDALCIKNADIFGASQGGMIALRLAADRPELVHKLIIGSALAVANDTLKQVTLEWIRLAEEKNERKLLESFAENIYSPKTLSICRKALLSSNSGITDEEYRRFIILSKACTVFDCRSVLWKIRCPVLAIGSEGDHITTAEGSRQLADTLGCELYIYGNGYGHSVYDEAPDYKKRCLNFFNK